MPITHENQVVYNNGSGRNPIAVADIGQQTFVDAVVEGTNAIPDFEALAPFSPGREVVFDKIGQTNYSGIFVAQLEDPRYRRFASSFLALYGHFKEQIRDGQVELQARGNGSVRAYSRTLDMELRVGD